MEHFPFVLLWHWKTKGKGGDTFGALKDVKITRLVESQLWIGTFASVNNTLALLSSSLVVYHLEPEMLENLTNVVNLEYTKAECLVKISWKKTSAVSKKEVPSGSWSTCVDVGWHRTLPPTPPIRRNPSTGLAETPQEWGITGEASLSFYCHRWFCF